MGNTRKLISIVTPCYNEEDNVHECYGAVRELFEGELAAYDYEHIFCDNASVDNTAGALREIASQDPRVKVILNSRNFGAFRSMFNGVLSASGDAVLVFLPADLQDPPRLIPEFVRKWEAGYQVVYGVRKTRLENPLMVMARKAFYRVVNALSDFYIPPDAGEFQLVDKVVIEALRKFDDHYPYLRGMIASCGFSATGIEYTWEKRKRGVSKASLYVLIDAGLNGIMSFTNVPLRLAIFAGFGLSVLSMLYAFVAFVLNVIYYRQFAAPGIPTLIVALFFLSGVQLLFIGLMGEYISAIHSQVRKRPLVIERERINFKA